MSMKMYYVANAYMPHEKAYGIQIAKMCEALVEEGVDLTLVLPNRGPQESLKEFYGLRVNILTIWLPSLVLTTYDRLGYLCMSLSFSVSYTLFLWYRFFRGERFVLYTLDTDNYSSSMLSFVPRPLFSEMHGAKPRTFATQLLFSRICGVIAINQIVIDDLKAVFPRSPARYVAEPNGVDLAMFSPRDKSQARTKLGLPLDVPTVLYTGRFYSWKGLEIIPRAATLTPEIRWQMVGDTREKFTSVVEEPLPSNIYFAGSRPYSEMPLWNAAADAVLVLGTKYNEQSYRWTSPMKLFEHLAAGRPVIASATPAVKEVVGNDKALLYEPDDVNDLASKARQAVKGGVHIAPLVSRATHTVQNLAWNKRASRVVHFIEITLNESLS